MIDLIPEHEINELANSRYEILCSTVLKYADKSLIKFAYKFPEEIKQLLIKYSFCLCLNYSLTFYNDYITSQDLKIVAEDTFIKIYDYGTLMSHDSIDEPEKISNNLKKFYEIKND